jgi:hypothetical protein
MLAPIFTSDFFKKVKILKTIFIFLRKVSEKVGLGTFTKKSLANRFASPQKTLVISFAKKLAGQLYCPRYASL